MEKRKRPSIFDLVEWYMERVLDEMRKLPSPTPTEEEQELSRMMRRGPQDFDEWLRDPFEEMMRELEEEMPEESKEMKRYGPFIYGFSYTKEPGKEPEIKEFGNIKPSYRKLEPSPGGEREPLTDVIDLKDAYEVVVELPGVEKDDLRLHATDDSLEIKTEGGTKFFKVVTFETPVKSETAKATYKNGVLSVTIKKRENEKKRTAIPLE